MNEQPEANDTEVTRRYLLRAGAAGLLGTAAATALTATPASADDGDPVILGQVNTAISPTTITGPEDGNPIVEFNGPEATLNVDVGLGSNKALMVNNLDGLAILASGQPNGVIAGGTEGFGVSGSSDTGIGVKGSSFVNTGIRAEGGQNGEGTAFEAVGPVKFSTSGLADLAVSDRRVKVNNPSPVPLTDQSKVLATLQGDAGSKVFVEHVELDSAAGTFDIVLTKPATHPVQVAWFLIS